MSHVRAQSRWPEAGPPRASLPLVLAALLALAAACDRGTSEIPVHQVETETFLVTQVESGQIQAASGDVIMSPRIGGSLKILYLYPEGAHVDVGDLVLQFDPADFEKEMMDREGRLEEAIMDYNKARAEREQRLADLKRNIQRAEAEFALAQLNLQRSQLDSPVEQERARIQLEKAGRALAEARQDSVAQEVVNRVDLLGRQHDIDRRRDRYEEARRDYERTSVYATRAGIVVYREIWKRGSEEQTKISVGDEVWGGRALMDIPDLSDMQVLCLIGEMDLKRMTVGQEALIRLDAFPGPVFHGQVASLAPMASPQPGAPDVRVFEMLIEVEEQDDRLRPGMSAEVEVVMETLPDTLSVPLEAVFTVDGADTVYRRTNGGFTPATVTLGARNSTAVVVVDGLEAGDVVALRDPRGL